MELGSMLGVVGMAVGFAGTIISNLAEKQELEEQVRKEVARQKEEEKEA